MSGYRDNVFKRLALSRNRSCGLSYNIMLCYRGPTRYLN